MNTTATEDTMNIDTIAAATGYATGTFATEDAIDRLYNNEFDGIVRHTDQHGWTLLTLGYYDPDEAPAPIDVHLAATNEDDAITEAHTTLATIAA